MLSDINETEKPVTVVLADGRIVDVFPSGTLHVYTADCAHGYEISLPQAWAVKGTISIVPLG